MMTTMMTMMLIYCMMMMAVKRKRIKEKGLDSKRKEKSINHSQAKNVQFPPAWGDTLNILSPLSLKQTTGSLLTHMQELPN